MSLKGCVSVTVVELPWGWSATSLASLSSQSILKGCKVILIFFVFSNLLQRCDVLFRIHPSGNAAVTQTQTKHVMEITQEYTYIFSVFNTTQYLNKP